MNQAFSFWRLPILSLLFIISFQCGFAQNKVPPVWTRPNLLWQDTLWKFKPGVANAGDFDAALNDSNWHTVNEDFRDNLIRDGLPWTGIGIFRKKFKVPDSLRNKRAELIMLVQFGASEVYFDGRLVRAFGKVAKDGRNEAEFIISPLTPPETPVQLDLGSESTHVIAVYYSYHGQQSFTDRIAGERGFSIMLAPFNAASASNYDVFNHPIISLCIILGFCLFFCFVYAFYPFRLASLFSLIYMGSFSLIFVSYLVRDVNHDFNNYVIGDSLWRIGFTCNPGWNVLFLYSIYYNRMPKRSWIVAALMILATAIGVFSNAFPLMIILPVLLLMTAESWRIIILGLRKKRTGFGILAIGFFISLAGGFVAIFDVFNLFPWYLTNAQTVAAIVTDLSFPLTLALQFAREFGSANRDLRKKLAQVNELSAKNSEQEREKQQILSMQNSTLERQVNERTNALQESITELKSTQAQLIQSEKMASLGQLTAGIAHEIQNPLNFVNNFSEVNNELIEELKNQKSRLKSEEQDELLNDIFQNNEKINHHGKRADAIVKGMLEHSRSASGEKQLTDINALAEEYLKLSYHGMRAKDKNFTATMKTEFDKSIDKVNVIGPDIGRVLLNLYNNAFYAVKPADLPLSREQYEPTVTVSTKKAGNTIAITVRDNGSGIPSNIIDKIFQPFFTTKPTGHGTGLGLSLAYDIIKANGGEIKVSSKQGEGTEFVILLPVQTS